MTGQTFLFVQKLRYATFLFVQKLRYATNPTVEWGPALVKHREEVAKYTPGFVIDPWNQNGSKTVSPNDVALQVGFQIANAQIMY